MDEQVYKMMMPVLPALAPIGVAVLKKIMPGVMAKMPVIVRPVLSVVFGIAISWLSGMAGGVAEVVTAGAVGGLAGMTARNFIVGKPYTSSERVG